jgi:hypothetical protein
VQVLARYFYVEHASTEVELYDMSVDPGQLTNVAGRPMPKELRAG